MADQLKTTAQTPKEPSITINGHTLTEAQAVTVRVALGLYHIDLTEAEWQELPPEDAVGIGIRDGYIKSIKEIYQLMESK